MIRSDDRLPVDPRRGAFDATFAVRSARCNIRTVRVVGKRTHGTGDRDGLDELVLQFGGGAPKGIFRYKTQEEANRDWDLWLSERVQRRTKTFSE